MNSSEDTSINQSWRESSDKLLQDDARDNNSINAEINEEKIGLNPFYKAGGNPTTQWDSTVPTVIDINSLKRDGLGPRQIAAYAVGHFNNDLSGSIWFTYVLYYVQEVVGLDPVIAGFVMLVGQVADGISTPIVGLGSDRCKTRIGARAPWYLAGSILVIPSIFCLFVYPELDQTSEVYYYIALASTFNIGFACVQISNMAIVNSITFSSQRRDRLISLRNGFTYVANFTVLTSALIIFVLLRDQIWQFRVLGFTIAVFGTLTSIFYLISLREPFLVKEAKRLQKAFKKIKSPDFEAEKRQRALTQSRSDSHSGIIKLWYHWLAEGQFYIYGLVYMMTRIAVNVTMSVQPFYLITVTGFVKTEENPTPIALALVPLVSYITSMIFSLFFYKKLMNLLQNRFIPFFVSIIVISLGSIPYIFLNSDPNLQWMVYVLSSIQGLGLAIMLNTATSLISDVIGKDDSSSAFVYGAYSFFEKITNGILIFLVTAYYNQSEQPLRLIIGITPVLCSVIAFALTYLGKVFYSEKMGKLSLNTKK
ncbi:UNKNOWN [Stylonychia lemnae]|uniref:Major facilitator superfamily protein n=1 Tax=Stylonychia lemnae TaxID=5949 RepID=A0A078AST4_STYLE|nr:UNKNOWN [Stylonychia lemnae]|eukprot:CDW85081.1 UNKNOWN [Stylonychia lemnae]